jgi:hypothetical protein
MTYLDEAGTVHRFYCITPDHHYGSYQLLYDVQGFLPLYQMFDERMHWLLNSFHPSLSGYRKTVANEGNILVLQMFGSIDTGFFDI